MIMAVKRMNYFTHQLLHEQDFKDEQAYHLEMRRRHNRTFHSWGVVEGLEVHQHGEREITIDAGMAIDREGREIFLHEKTTRDLGSFSHGSDDVFITIRYREEMDENDHLSAGGVAGYTRVTESAEVHERHHDSLEETELVLARVRRGEHGHITDVDMSPSIRKAAKTEPSSVLGWMRLPFKPVRLAGVRIGGQLAGGESAEHDFIVDEATAYCGEHGARGSMQIPVPPGATHISGFRVAGTAGAEVVVRLFRTGWNLRESKGELTQLLEEKLKDGSFHKDVHVSSSLDESHALAVSIRAEGEAKIWLVAAKFE